MEETVNLYMEEHPNVKIESVLQATESLYPSWRAAAEAKEGPDIQLLWSGLWAMEDVWAGNVAPVSDYLSEEEMSHIFPSVKEETSWQGKVWGEGWFMSPQGMAYNKEMFAEAGLDPDNPPQTWDELMEACDALNAIDVIPWSYGCKGETGTGNFLGMFLTQDLDDPAELLTAVVGDASFTDEKYSRWISKLDEAIERGCFNEDVTSLEYYQGCDLFAAGESAMTGGIAVALATSYESEMGSDVVGYMLAPTFGKGKAAKTMGNTAQQLVITSFSPHKEEAADVLEFFHTPDRLNAMYTMGSALPPDDRFDTSIMTLDTPQKTMEWAKTATIWWQIYMPSKIDREAFGVVVDQMFLRESTPEEAAQFIEDYVAKWREENPDMVETLRDWK
jgi:multiple sugar transport system substrate-binding protein